MVTSATRAAICAGVKPITYSRFDTPETIKQVKEANLFNINRGCFAKGPHK